MGDTAAFVIRSFSFPFPFPSALSILQILSALPGFQRISEFQEADSGETKTVSSDILIGIAKEFRVSTDYIPGLSAVSVQKSYDISQLGLSGGAVWGLVTGMIDVEILNRLLEHKNFPRLISLIRIYFQDTAARGVMAQNKVIEMAAASLADLMKDRPEYRAETRIKGWRWLEMKEDIVAKLTAKDDKYACALADKIISESQETDEWYEYFNDFASLLNHPKSLVRNRVLYILAANAQWDEENHFDSIISDFLTHITDEKPITARQCIKALAQVGAAKPQYIPRILSCLQGADLSKYKDSMRPLIEKDIAETEKILKTL